MESEASLWEESPQCLLVQEVSQVQVLLLDIGRVYWPPIVIYYDDDDRGSGGEGTGQVIITNSAFVPDGT